jgi:hypothetical protein
MAVSCQHPCAYTDATPSSMNWQYDKDLTRAFLHRFVNLYFDWLYVVLGLPLQ